MVLTSDTYLFTSDQNQLDRFPNSKLNTQPPGNEKTQDFSNIEFIFNLHFYNPPLEY